MTDSDRAFVVFDVFSAPMNREEKIFQKFSTHLQILGNSFETFVTLISKWPGISKIYQPKEPAKVFLASLKFVSVEFQGQKSPNTKCVQFCQAPCILYS